MSDDHSAKHAPDLVVAGSLLVATFLYLAAFPRDLGIADESYLLLEAARIRGGEVMYRDIFEVTTPMASYAMALAYWLFGTTIDTARLSTAALHGLTSALLYLSCRRAGVRPALAVAAAVAYLTISQPAWPFASWHWYSTLLATLVLFNLLGRRWSPHPGRAIVSGLLVGLLVGVQQQKGAVFTAAVGLLLVLDPLLDRRFGGAEPWQRSRRRLFWFGAGIALIIVPLLAASLATAGWERLYDALVRYPLETYRPNYQIAWGRTTLLAAAFANQTFPTLLRFAPLVCVPALARAGAALVRRRERPRLRLLTVLLICSAANALSIAYYPDVIHIAFIAPVFLVGAAELAESGLAFLARRRSAAGALGWLLAAAVCAALLPRLASNLTRARALYPHIHDTAFGRVAFHSRWEPLFIDHVRELLRAAGTRELFCYPNAIAPYLTIGAVNPTPYQHFIAPFSPAAQTQEVLAILKERDLPYLIGSPLLMRADDPVVAFMNERYEVATVPAIEQIGERSTLWLYRRKNAAASPLTDRR